MAGRAFTGSMMKENAMIEYIEKQTMLEDFESCNRSNPKWTPQRVKTLIVRQPPADAAPVIRCKDCAKDGLTTCPMCWIENHTLEFINHDPNFYCGAAERK